MGFNISEKLGGDPKLVIEGVWIDEMNGLRLLIARWNNKNYRKFLRGLVTSPKSKLERFKLDMDVMDDRNKEAVARTILLGWEGLEEDGPVNAEGKSSPIKVEYSIEKAIQCFNDYPEFYDMIIEYAQDISLFKGDKEEEAAKN